MNHPKFLCKWEPGAGPARTLRIPGCLQGVLTCVLGSKDSSHKWLPPGRSSLRVTSPPCPGSHHPGTDPAPLLGCRSCPCFPGKPQLGEGKPSAQVSSLGVSAGPSMLRSAEKLELRSQSCESTVWSRMMPGVSLASCSSGEHCGPARGESVYPQDFPQKQNKTTLLQPQS